MKALKVFTGIALLVSQLFTFSAPAMAEVAGEMRKLLVTAYYSPLPDQTMYIRGSYDGDVRLNGRGTNGANGTEVFEGMLAAPKTYPFGTRVRIPGLGVGEVHDRGGAILANQDYDRIDVWMGRGDDGLSRALNWGARMVMGEIFWNADQVEPGFDFSWVSPVLPESLVKRLSDHTLQNPAVFDRPITPASNQEDLKELQTALTTLGYYFGEIDGTYTDITRDAVKAFQMDRGVISSDQDAGAGNFGPLTKSTLKGALEGYNSAVVKERSRIENNLTLLTLGLGKDSQGDDVMALQQMLWELSYYTGELNGHYDQATIDAVFDFQKAQGIVASEWDSGAGYYGKKTHEALVAAVLTKISMIGSYPMQIQAWVPAARELPKIASLAAPVESMERQALYFSPDLADSHPVFADETETPTDTGLIVHELDLEDRNAEVVKLQNILIEGGFLAADMNTGYYGAQTADAVTAYQVKNGIITSANDVGAGRVGPKTLARLNS